LRHTTFVVDDVENDYDEATTNIKGSIWDVALRKAATATVHSRELPFFFIQ